MAPSGLADRARGRRADDRRSGADRLDLQAGRGARRDAAGRAGPARSRPRRFGLSRLDACATRPFRTGRSRCGCCSRIAPRSGTTSNMGDPARDRASQQSLADPAAFDADASARRLFRYANLSFPLIASVMERAVGRALRPADGAAGARAARPRRLLQLDDLQRRRALPARVVLYAAGRQRDPRRSRRPPPGLPGARARRRAVRPRRLRARQQRRPVLAAGRPAHLGARPRRDRPAAAQPRPPRRRPLPERGEHRRAADRPSGASTAATARPKAASIAPMASPCRACRSPGTAAATTCSATAGR